MVRCDSVQVITTKAVTLSHNGKGVVRRHTVETPISGLVQSSSLVNVLSRDTKLTYVNLIRLIHYSN